MTAAHGGRGEIRARAIWESRDFRTNFWAVGHAVLGPGTSVGYHRHDTIEECYAIMAGRGRMTVDGRTFVVEPHDVIMNRLGGCHGIVNDGPNDLELLTVAVSMVKGEADEDDLGDDLMGSG